MQVIEEYRATHQALVLNHNLFIVWQPEYNLGIPIIDEHHKGIVSTINSLYFGIQNNYAEDLLVPIIDMMHDYTRIHFQIEESFLEKIDYPNAKRHHELHRELTNKLIHNSRTSLLHKNPNDFMEFLKNWWINHICKEDFLFRDHVLLLAEK